MATISSSSSSASTSSIVSSQYAFEMAKAWRTDNVAQDPMKGDMFGRPELVRAPSQVAAAPNPQPAPAAAPLAPPPSPTAAIEAFLRGMEQRMTGEMTALRGQVAAQSAQLATQTSEIRSLRGEVTALTGKVDDLGDTIKAVNKQVSNLVSMGFCDKIKTLAPCCNHLKNVSVRGLTAKELDLVQKSKTIQLQGAK